MPCDGMQYEPLGLTSDGFCFALTDANQRRLECACHTYEQRREWEHYVEGKQGERRERSTGKLDAQKANNRAPERVLLYLAKRSVLHRPAREILDLNTQAFLFRDLQDDDEAMRFCFPERYRAHTPSHEAAESGGRDGGGARDSLVSAAGSGAGGGVVVRSSSGLSEHAKRIKRGSIIEAREHQASGCGGVGVGGAQVWARL